MLEKYFQLLSIALEAVFANRTRSILTALGIIFGVAAVIAMMAIGTGAKQEILEQMKLVGVNNIIIIPLEEKNNNNADGGDSEEAESNGNSNKTSKSTGLTLKDVESIRKIVPTWQLISPEVIYDVNGIFKDVSVPIRLNGVTPSFFEVYGLEIEKGRSLSESQVKNGDLVCVIGAKVKAKFFPRENPIGKRIKCDDVWFKIIGVLENRLVGKSAIENLGLSSFNNGVYAPITSVLLRYKDRSAIKSEDERRRNDNDTKIKTNINQLDKLIIQVKDSEQISPTSALIHRILLRRHMNERDFEIKIPELLLKQEQQTKDIFNIVLGAIASISLIVGGIGIMNIMLASVMERIREIGVRMATGARKQDIVFQFLSEATIISISGGLLGIILGITISKVIMQITDILTIVSPMSIFISFGVSVAVGIIFGYMPAKKASEQDPVVSLRHD